MHFARTKRFQVSTYSGIDPSPMCLHSVYNELSGHYVCHAAPLKCCTGSACTSLGPKDFKSLPTQELIHLLCVSIASTKESKRMTFFTPERSLDNYWHLASSKYTIIKRFPSNYLHKQARNVLSLLSLWLCPLRNLRGRFWFLGWHMNLGSTWIWFLYQF
jgi:hypothetical protein